MDNEIDLVSDGDGLAVVGSPHAVDRFLAAAGLPSKDLDLPRLSTILSTSAIGAQAASGQWEKLGATGGALGNAVSAIDGFDDYVARAFQSKRHHLTDRG